MKVVISRGVWEECVAAFQRDPVGRFRAEESRRLHDLLWSLPVALAEAKDKQLVRFLSPVTNRNGKPVMLTALCSSDSDLPVVRLMLQEEEQRCESR